LSPMRLNIAKLILFPATLISASCGITTSKVITAEDGTYVISGKGYASGQNNVFPILYSEANSYCSEQGKILMPIACEGDFKSMDSTKVKLTFRCVPGNVPGQH